MRGSWKTVAFLSGAALAGCSAQAPPLAALPAPASAGSQAGPADRTVSAGPMGGMGGQPMPGGWGGRHRGGGWGGLGSGPHGPPIMRAAPPPPPHMGGPFDVTPGYPPTDQAQWDYINARIAWQQRMALPNAFREWMGWQPWQYPPYQPPGAAPQDPWAGRGSFRTTPPWQAPPHFPPVPMGGR